MFSAACGITNDNENSVQLSVTKSCAVFLTECHCNQFDESKNPDKG